MRRRRDDDLLASPWWEFSVESFEDAIKLLGVARLYMLHSARAIREAIALNACTIRRWERGETKRIRPSPHAAKFILSYVKAAQEEKRRRARAIADAFESGRKDR